MKEKHRQRPRGLGWAAMAGLALPLALASTTQPDTHVAAAMADAPASLPPALAEPAGATPLPANFNVADFEKMAQQLTVGQRVPGLALAIVHDGQVLSERGYGITDVSAPQAIDAHTVFRLASLSKAFATALTGLLVDDGTLRWDSRVVDYVPNFQFNDADATRQLRVADVISQRTGLHAHNAFDRDIEKDAEYSAVSQKLSTAPLDCAPGQCYSYQNVAFNLIGDVVFASTGNLYASEVQTRLFRPLGMNDASIGLAGIESSPAWAHPHVRNRNGWTAQIPKPNYYRLPAAAGVNASISDMAQWLIAQSGHRPDVLPAPLLATLHAPVIDTPGEIHGSGWRRERVGSAGYALGWRVFDYAGHPLVFHAGAVQGYRGMLAMLPESNLGVAILWNSDSNLPAGLLPTILDRALNLPAQPWLDLPDEDSLMLAETAAATTPANKPAQANSKRAPTKATSAGRRRGRR